jgi:hypothetical protein
MRQKNNFAAFSLPCPSQQTPKFPTVIVQAWEPAGGNAVPNATIRQ